MQTVYRLQFVEEAGLYLIGSIKHGDDSEHEE